MTTSEKLEFEFEVPVDDSYRCTEFKPFKRGLPHCGRRRVANPHMRGFWGATIAFNVAFVGWFALAPLMTVVRKDIGICDNNVEVQLDIENVECVCKASCKSVIADAKIASVSFDIFVRFILGGILERLGPVNTDCWLLCIGALVVGMGAFISNGTGLIVIRFFVSLVGATFVVNQFWNSMLFAPSVKGTANATAGGWGNLGGGITQILMPLIYMFFHDVIGLSLHWSWRVSMIVPTVLFVIVAAWLKLFTQDTPRGKFTVDMLGKTRSAGIMTYIECLMDYRVVLMILQYGACFGAQLVMHNALHTHFHDYFKMDDTTAGIMASAFGFMNLFARSLGGILSDWMGKRWGMTGRLWAHFISLVLAAVFLFVFGCVTVDMGAITATIVIAVFSVFDNMAEGTSYGIVPFMIEENIAVVSSLVGAGGTAGAVIALFAFYKYVDDPLIPFQLHSGYLMLCALSVLLMGWPIKGSMFRLAETNTSKAIESKAVPEPLETTPDVVSL